MQCPDLGQSLRHMWGSQKGSLVSPFLGCWVGTCLGCQSFLIPPWGMFWFQQISKCSSRSALLLGFVVVGFFPCYFRCSAVGWEMLHMHKESSMDCRKAINSPDWGGSGWKPNPGKWEVKDSALAWLCAQRCWELCCHWLQQAQALEKPGPRAMQRLFKPTPTFSFFINSVFFQVICTHIS